MAEDTNSEGITVREIHDSSEFYTFLHNSGLHSLTYNLYDFYTKYKQINVGCGCSKKNRVDIANNAYVNSLCSLTKEQELNIKEALQADTVRFYLNAGIFAEFK